MQYLILRRNKTRVFKFPKCLKLILFPINHFSLLFTTPFYSSSLFHHSTFTIHHSSFTTHHSPPTSHHPPFTTHHSPPTIHHPPFTTHPSPFTLHHLTPHTLALQFSSPLTTHPTFIISLSTTSFSSPHHPLFSNHLRAKPVYLHGWQWLCGYDPALR